jgi:NAD(P) transhydrogenase
VETYDLVILGSGPAGEKAAAQAAYFGKRVAIVEKEPEPGGAAVHTGTLPSKTLRESALFLSGHRSRALYGVSVELSTDATLQKLMARKTAIAVAESRRIRENLKKHDATYLQGHGRLAGEHRVSVEGTEGSVEVGAEYVLVSTGSVPRQPDDIAFESVRIHDSDEILEIDDIPKSMTILGAGVIGSEYACMFAALGVQIDLVDARPGILPFLDREIRDQLAHAMGSLGIRLRQPHRWGAVVDHGSSVTVELDDGTVLENDELLFAAGRVGNTADIGLDTVGLEANGRGYLEVDDAYRTTIPHILAVGDVIGFPALASTSMEQGRVAVCRAFGFDYKQSVHDMLPYGIYTIPEVSSVGKSEAEAREAAIPYVTGRAKFAENARGQIQGDLEGLVKLVVHAEKRTILGVHVVGERASELVHLGQAAMLMGATVDLFIDMVFNFPTLSEAYKYAAYDALGALAKHGS